LSYTLYDDANVVTSSYLMSFANATIDYVAAATETTVWRGSVQQDMPPKLREEYLETAKYIPGTNWPLESCSGEWQMAGEPTGR